MLQVRVLCYLLLQQHYHHLHELPYSQICRFSKLKLAQYIITKTNSKTKCSNINAL